MVSLLERATADEVPAGYRMTELGLLPEEWRVSQLGDAGRLVRGLTYGREDVREVHDPSALPILRATNITPTGLALRDNLVAVRRDLVKGVQHLQIADVVIAMSSGSKAVVGKAAPLTQPWLGSFGAFCAVFRPDAAVIDPAFAAMVFQTSAYRHRIGTVARGTNINNLSKEHILGFKFPFPPLPEQRAIAHVLSTVQQAREATEAIIAATRELKRSLMRHLFTYGPVPVDQVGEVQLRETEIGMVPEHWNVEPLGATVRSTQYGLSLRGEAVGSIPILRMNCLINGRVEPHQLQYVSLSERDLTKFRLLPDDVLFNRTNSFELVGKTGLFDLPGDYVFASYLVRITVEASVIMPAFLNLYLNWHATQRRLKNLASRGVSQSNISASKLRTLKLALPTLVEQRRIAETLSALDRKLHVEEARKASLDVLFKTLLQQFMTGRLRALCEAISETC
jgi:type I restriction enzyme, S subunit